MRTPIDSGTLRDENGIGKEDGANGAALSRRSKNAVKIAAFLIALCFLAVIVLGAVGLTEGASAFLSEISFSETPIRYSEKLTARFYRAFRLFFLTDNVENPLFEWLIDDVYAALSAARIPSEKVVWLVEKVETIRGENNPAYLWIQEKTERYDALMREFEAGLREEEPTYHDVISTDEMKNGMTGVLTFLAESPLTNDELGRLIFRSAKLYSGDAEYSALLDKIGEEDISMLTVGTYRVYKTAEAFASAESVGAARSIGQSLVALGSSYLSLIKKVGLDAVDTLFGLDHRIEEGKEDTLISVELIPYYNRQLDELEGFAGGALLLAGEILFSVTDGLFEELYYANIAARDGKISDAELHRFLAARELSYAIRTGLDRAEKKSENRFVTDREAINMLSKAYAASFRMNDILEENVERLSDETRYERYRTEADEKLSLTLRAVDTLSAYETGVSNADLFQKIYPEYSSDPSSRDFYTNLTGNLFDYDFSDPDRITDLLFGLAVNAFVRLFGNL